MAENKIRSFLDNLKKTAETQKNYGLYREAFPPVMDATVCPHCGERDGQKRMASLIAPTAGAVSWRSRWTTGYT